MKIGFIGLGNMGAILARLVAQAGSYDLLLANRTKAKAEVLAQEIGGKVVSNDQVFAEADVIFLGVKPAQFRELLQEQASLLKERSSLLLISMAAGLTLESLREMVGDQHRLIRVMPNTPIAVGKGVISYACSDEVSAADQALLEELLQAGAQLFCLDEKLMDAATALAGCGPAFVYPFIEAMSDAGVKLGLPRDLALKMAAQTVLGAGQMVAETGQHPAILKDQVCSPAGSTIAGVASLEKKGLRGVVMEAIEQAFQRTQELGK